MIGAQWYALWVLLASAGLGSVTYSVADFINHEWAATHLAPLMLGGGGFLPFVLLAGWATRQWQRLGVDISLDRARAKTNELANQARELELKAILAVSQTDDDEDAPPTAHRATAVGVLRFFTGGNALGFAFDGLYAAGLLTQPTWQRLKDFYLCWPEESPVLIDRGGSAGTVWAPTWTLGKVSEQLALGEFPLPLGAPPAVSVYIPSQHNTKQNKKTQKTVVVEGVARQVGEG